MPGTHSESRHEQGLRELALLPRRSPENSLSSSSSFKQGSCRHQNLFSVKSDSSSLDPCDWPFLPLRTRRAACSPCCPLSQEEAQRGSRHVLLGPSLSWGEAWCTGGLVMSSLLLGGARASSVSPQCTLPTDQSTMG